MYFVRNHPYCNIDSIILLVGYHIKQNIDIYYPHGIFNV
jgi:hypothetical protein